MDFLVASNRLEDVKLQQHVRFSKRFGFFGHLVRLKKTKGRQPYYTPSIQSCTMFFLFQNLFQARVVLLGISIIFDLSTCCCTVICRWIARARRVRCEQIPFSWGRVYHTGAEGGDGVNARAISIHPKGIFRRLPSKQCTYIIASAVGIYTGTNVYSFWHPHSDSYIHTGTFSCILCSLDLQKDHRSRPHPSKECRQQAPRKWNGSNLGYPSNSTVFTRGKIAKMAESAKFLCNSCITWVSASWWYLDHVRPPIKHYNYTMICDCLTYNFGIVWHTIWYPTVIKHGNGTWTIYRCFSY